MARQDGALVHHAVMNGSLHALFNNPGTRASAHFNVFRDGRIEQYVDTNIVAWHSGNTQGNTTTIGVETEGCGPPPHAEPMTDAMVSAFARLYAEGQRRHGWPNALQNQRGQRGLGFHRLWNATACPCDPRLNMRPEILRRAAGQAPTPVEDKPAQPQGGAMALRTSPAGDGAYYIFGSDGGVFAFGGAHFFGSIPGNKVKLNAPIVGGAVTQDGGGYWMVGADGGVFAFGNAQFHGSMGGKKLNAPVTGIERSGGGYLLLGRDGGVFAFNAPFHGSAAGKVAMA